jgi:hypothetical protein
MIQDLYTPEGFYREFISLIARWPKKKGKWVSESHYWIKWFELQMNKIAKKNKLVCHNKRSSGEIMRVNHTFMLKEGYQHFPLISVEHECETLGSRRGELPGWNSDTADVEWALWKSLTMRSRLSVMVCYPFEFEKKAALAVCEKMLAGYRKYYGSAPNCLLMFGWNSKLWEPVLPFVFEPYRAVEDNRLRPRLQKIELPGAD